MKNMCDCVPRNNCNFVKNDYGYCCYFIKSNEAWIFNLYVYPDFRRLGHARELLKECIDIIKNSGYTGGISIGAEPQEDSIPLRKLIEFYKSLGLSVINQL